MIPNIAKIFSTLICYTLFHNNLFDKNFDARKLRNEECFEAHRMLKSFTCLLSKLIAWELLTNEKYANLAINF